MTKITTKSIYRPEKDEVNVEHGAVATAHPIAAQVGVDVLQNGGNAIDAAIATGFCLNVIEPWNSSIAGHGQMIVHVAAEGKTVAIDYGHRAPKAATAEMFDVIGQTQQGNGIYEVAGRANFTGHLSVGVPGVTAGMCKAHEMFGSLPLEELLEPAIHYARYGFEVDQTSCFMIAQAMADLLELGESGRIFLPTGYPPLKGERLIQSDLAETLRRISHEGKDALYSGKMAHIIDEEMRLNGGILSVEDLADYDAQVLEPLRITYRGYEIFGSPVPAGTITEFQTLKILENFKLNAFENNSPEYLHLIIEALRNAFADRYRFLGDPNFVPVPLEGMLSTEYAQEISSSINPKQSTLESDLKLQPWVFFAEEEIHDPWRYTKQKRPEKALTFSSPYTGDCTTHFSIIDKYRNMISCTQTAVGVFGSRVIIPGTGILLTNGMVVFNPMPGSANSIAGYKRGLNNMSPVLVLKDGKPFLSLGAPGGRRIISRIAQVLVNIIDFELGIQDAISSPTVDASERDTLLDRRHDTKTLEALGLMGHNVVVEPVTGDGFSRPRGVLFDHNSNRLRAGVHVTGLDEARGY